MRRAFTVAEVVVALALTALSVLCLISVLIGSLRLLQTSQEVSEATGLGRQLMERIQAVRPLPVGIYDGRLGQPAVAGFPPAPYPGSVTSRYDYRARVSIAHFDDYLDSVRVEIFWNGRAQLQLASLQVR
ncbi:MAG: hypothetical protein U0931_06460 [Vulcanimicrobiota bacterium]